MITLFYHRTREECNSETLSSADICAMYPFDYSRKLRYNIVSDRFYPKSLKEGARYVQCEDRVF